MADELDPTFSAALLRLHTDIAPGVYIARSYTEYRIWGLDEATWPLPYDYMLFDLYAHCENDWRKLAVEFLRYFPYSIDVARWIGILDAMFNARQEYHDKWGHYPVDTARFITEYINNDDGRELVLATDTY